MIIDHALLSAEVLDALIESYVMREGTDYGEQHYSLSEKVSQLKQQLQAGVTVITFDPTTETVNLLTREQAQQCDLTSNQDV